MPAEFVLLFVSCAVKLCHFHTVSVVRLMESNMTSCECRVLTFVVFGEAVNENVVCVCVSSSSFSVLTDVLQGCSQKVSLCMHVQQQSDSDSFLLRSTQESVCLFLSQIKHLCLLPKQAG